MRYLWKPDKPIPAQPSRNKWQVWPRVSWVSTTVLSLWLVSPAPLLSVIFYRFVLFPLGFHRLYIYKEGQSRWAKGIMGNYLWPGWVLRAVHTGLCEVYFCSLMGLNRIFSKTNCVITQWQKIDFDFMLTSKTTLCERHLSLQDLDKKKYK